MPVALAHPGVYIEEIPSGVRTITGVATSIAAFLGRAASGAVDKPVTIFSFADFERKFGGLGVNYPMSYAVADFFRNGGGQAIIVRIVKRGDIAASTGSLAADSLTLKAASPGSWFNNLSAIVETIKEDATTKSIADRLGFKVEDLFNLTIILKAPDGRIVAQERFINVTVKDVAAGRGQRIDRVLEQQSQFVRTQEPAAEATRPKAGEYDAQPPVADSGDLDDLDYLGDAAAKTGLHAFDSVDLFNLLCIPPDKRNGSTTKKVYQDALEYCVGRRAMLIIDPPHEWGSDFVSNEPVAKLTDLGFSGDRMRNGAIYFPRLTAPDPLSKGQVDTFAPCGAIAGVMAATDVTRGVWKAPAGLDAGLNGISGLSVKLTDGENGTLNQVGINCLRNFPIHGSVVWGARTLRGADQMADEYKYIPVRRLALFIEESLYRGTQWAVFEPNDEPLWAQIRLNVGAFMHNLFVKGAFQGQTPASAYFVRCDKDTTTQNDINLGVVNVVVGFAPLKPAEFVVIQIQQIAGNILT